MYIYVYIYVYVYNEKLWKQYDIINLDLTRIKLILLLDNESFNWVGDAGGDVMRTPLTNTHNSFNKGYLVKRPRMPYKGI